MALFQPLYLSHVNFPEWHLHDMHSPHFISHLGESASWLHKPFHPAASDKRHGATPPAFDVHETQTHYFLDGDFPGTRNKDDIKIEWTGQRTLVIEAKVSKVDLEKEWGITLPRVKHTLSTPAPNRHSPPPPEASTSRHDHDDEKDNTALHLHRCHTRNETDDSSLPPNRELEPTEPARANSTTSSSQDSHSSQNQSRPAGPTRRRSSISPENLKKVLSWPKARRASQQQGVEGSAPAPALHTWTAERHTGPFKRTFVFPEEVEHESLKARLDRGVLKILVVKSAPMTPKPVAIDAAAGYFAD